MWWVTPEVPSLGTPGASPEQGPCFQVCGHLHRAQELAEEGRAGAHLGRKITGAFSKQSPFRWLTEPGAVLLLDKMQGSLPKPALRCANSPPEAVPRALQLPRGGGGGGGVEGSMSTQHPEGVGWICFAGRRCTISKDAKRGRKGEIQTLPKRDTKGKFTRAAESQAIWDPRPPQRRLQSCPRGSFRPKKVPGV